MLCVIITVQHEVNILEGGILSVWGYLYPFLAILLMNLLKMQIPLNSSMAKPNLFNFVLQQAGICVFCAWASACALFNLSTYNNPNQPGKYDLSFCLTNRGIVCYNNYAKPT